MIATRNIMAGAFLAVSLLAAVSCDNFEDPQKSFIRNDSPEEGASYDLADGNVTFRWQVGGVQESGYCFSLAADRYGDAAQKVELLPTKFSYEANAVDLDKILKSWGYLPRQTVTAWWRIESVDGSVSDLSEYRKINLTTLAMDAVDIVVNEPDDNAMIAVNDAGEVKFSWEPVPNADVYSLEFSLTDSGEPLKLATDTDSYTSAEAVISADVFRLIYDEYIEDNAAEVLLYWKVRSGTAEAPGSSFIRTVRLVGELLPVSSFTARPGDHKAELSWTVTDSRISKVKIQWGENGSEEVNVPAGSTQMSHIVENLEPGTCTFTLTSYDASGEPSETSVTAEAEVYDLASFRESLKQNSISILSLLRDGVTLSITGETDANLSYSELSYIGADGSEKNTAVEKDAQSVTLAASDLMAGGEVTFSQHYSPAVGALDDVVKEQKLHVPAYSLVALSEISHWPNADNTGALPNEMTNYNASFPYAMLFDGKADGDGLNMWHTTGDGIANNSLSADHPIIATFDLGAEYNLSSYVVWGRYGGTADKPLTDGQGDGITGYFAFGSYNPRAFKLYGSAEAPKNPTDQTYWAVDGGWLDDWTLLADSRVVRPSLDVPTVKGDQTGTDWVPTAEDFEAAAEGFEFAIDRSLPAVRYLRLVITETWDPSKRYRISFGEMHFYQYTPEEQ